MARKVITLEIDASRVSRDLTRELDRLKTGNARAPELSAEVLDLMREGWTLASLEFNSGRVRSIGTFQAPASGSPG